jgi:hypothetical protein
MIDPLIGEAKERARRRRRLLVAAALLLTFGLTLGLEITSGGSTGSSSAVPWLSTKPSIGPAHPPLASPCTASQLRATVFEQAAAGNLAAGIQLVNRSAEACALVGRPQLSLAGWRITPWHQGGAAVPYDPLAPAVGSLRALPPHEHVRVQLWMPGYCHILPAANSRLSKLVFTAPGGGRVGLGHATFPSCAIPPGLTVQATRYTPFVPNGGPSSALPLKARIAAGRALFYKGKTIRDPARVTRAGDWLLFTVVLTNVSRKAFQFGRTCPAYVEGIYHENQTYVLNCQDVGPIAPHRSVRFAMRVHVPAHANLLSEIGWTLAPHSYNAPQALAPLVIR